MAQGRVDIGQPEDLEAGAQKFNTAEAALSAFYQRGFTPPPMPAQQQFGQPYTYAGVLPQNLPQLDDISLGSLLTQISTWLAYAEAELAKAESLRSDVENRLEFLKARIRIALKANPPEGKKLTEQDKKDWVTADPRVVQEQVNLLFTTALYEYTKSIVKTGQRDWETTSRRITQRGQEIDRMSREGSLGSVPVQSRTFHR